MALKVSGRGSIPPFIVMDVVRAAAEREFERRAVYHMEIGQPGTPAPEGARRAAHEAIDRQDLGYTVALGDAGLRARIARHYREYYGFEVDRSRVVVTTGSSAGFVLAFLAAFDAGDRVALAIPGYPCYRHTLSALGIEPVLLLAEAEDRFQPTPELIETAVAAGGPIDGLIVASPSNPAGTMLDRDAMAALTAYCGSNGIRMVSDEIYHGITYGRRAVTVLELDDDAIVVNSFSKYYSMTGWRLGWMVVPEDMVRAVECVSQNLFLSPPTLSQVAALAAFDCTDELEGNVARYAANRERLVGELPKAGFRRLAPIDGAFYAYADLEGVTGDSVAFCRRILDETGVAATPGLDFDPVRGRRFMRFSFAGSEETVAGAAAALIQWKRQRAVVGQGR